VKGKVHLPGHKKRQGDDGQANEGDSSDYSSDDSPKVRHFSLSHPSSLATFSATFTSPSPHLFSHRWRRFLMAETWSGDGVQRRRLHALHHRESHPAVASTRASLPEPRLRLTRAPPPRTPPDHINCAILGPEVPVPGRRQRHRGTLANLSTYLTSHPKSPTFPH
jgi:hypothetical protein